MPYDDPGLRSGDLNRSILGDTGRANCQTIAIRKTNHGFCIDLLRQVDVCANRLPFVHNESVHTATGCFEQV